MVGWRQGIAGALVWAFMAAVAVPTLAQSNARRVRRSGDMAGSFIAVMGAVRNSGVYEFPSAVHTLDDLLREAGGLTKDAGGTVRIVRNGRPAIQTHLSIADQTQLLPDDVVQVSSAVRKKRGESGPVEVALVDLLGHPVVIRLRPEHSDLQSLISLLRQSEDVAANTRVLQLRRSVSQGSGDQIPLGDGSVVVFPRNEINASRLPQLPTANHVRGSAIRPTDASKVQLKAPPQNENAKPTGKLDGPLFGPPGQQPPDRPRGPKVVDVAAMARTMLEEARADLNAGRLEQARSKALAVKQLPFDSSSLADGPDDILAEIDRRNRRQPAPIVGPPPRFPMDDVNDGAPDGRESVGARANSPWNPATPTEPGMPPMPGEDDNGKIATDRPFPAAPAEQPISVSKNKQPDEALAKPAPPEADEQTGSVDFVTLVIGIFAAFGVLSAIAFLVSMGRKAAGDSSPVARLLKRVPTRLDKLIRDELEVCDEPMTLAATLEFFGRPPISRTTRFDGDHLAEPVSGPMFAPRNDSHADSRTERESSARGDLQDRAKTIRPDAAQPATPPPSHATQNVLDRAVRRAMQKESA